MGLRDTVQKATKTAFTATGDIAVDAWYYGHASTRYEVSAGYVSVQNRQYLLSAVFTKYKNREADAQPADLQMLVPTVDVIFKPAIHDKVQRLENETSITYEVLDFEQDPAKAFYRFMLLKP